MIFKSIQVHKRILEEWGVKRQHLLSCQEVGLKKFDFTSMGNTKTAKQQNQGFVCVCVSS